MTYGKFYYLSEKVRLCLIVSKNTYFACSKEINNYHEVLKFLTEKPNQTMIEYNEYIKSLVKEGVSPTKIIFNTTSKEDPADPKSIKKKISKSENIHKRTTDIESRIAKIEKERSRSRSISTKKAKNKSRSGRSLSKSASDSRLEKKEDTRDFSGIFDDLNLDNVKIFLFDCNLGGCSLKDLKYTVVNTISLENNEYDVLVIENEKPYIASNLPILYSLCRGLPIVTKRWLKDSSSSKKLLPVTNYLLKNIEFEKKYGFEFKQIYQNNKNGKCDFLKGNKFYLSNKIMDRDMIGLIIQASKGEIIDTLPKNNKSENIYIVTKKLEDSNPEYSNFNVITSDIIKNSVLSGQFTP